MRLLVCGDRNWTNGNIMVGVILALNPDTIIEGECKGADRLAATLAVSYKIPLERFPANWDIYGKGAGHVRNTQMLKEGKPELIAAFHKDIENSRGTANMLCQAEDAGIPYILIEEE